MFSEYAHKSLLALGQKRGVHSFSDLTSWVSTNGDAVPLPLKYTFFLVAKS